MLIANAFPGRVILAYQDNGQCVNCFGKVWRVLLEATEYAKHRLWVTAEPGYWGSLHICPNAKPEAA